MQAKTKGIVAGILGAFFWGISNVLVAFMTSNYVISPTWLGCLRVLTAGAVFTAVCAATDKDSLLALLRDRRALAGTVLYAIFGIAALQVTYVVAIDTTSAATESLVGQLNLVYMMAFTCLRARRRPRPAEAAGLVLALAGVWCIATKGDPSSLVVGITGLAWCLLDSVLAFLHNSLPLCALERHGSLPVNAVGMLLGGIILLPFARPWAAMPALDAVGWAAFAGTTVFGAILGYFLVMQSLKEAGPMVGSLLMIFTPATAVAASAIALGTPITAFDLIGLALILAMMALMALSKRGEKTTEATPTPVAAPNAAEPIAPFAEKCA